MSARLIKALAQRKVIVRNTGSGEVIVNHPLVDGVNFTIIPPLGRVNLTDTIPIKELRKSPNLANLVKKGNLTVEE